MAGTVSKIYLIPLAALGVVALLAAALFFPLWLATPRLYGPEELELGRHAYSAEDPIACVAGSRTGPAGESANEETAEKRAYLVKTPANYDATRAHPLIVVYAPRGASRMLTERFVGLTHRVTEQGFVIAYAGSHPLDLATVGDLATIPERIAERWCIDERRIHLTGHSDGGTVATAAVVTGRVRFRPASIAPSAAGFRREDLAAYPCPPPLSVVILQNAADTLFPDYGRSAAAWWAACNGCDAAHPRARGDGCLVYGGCAEGVATLFCEGEGTHRDWPRRNQTMIEVFRSATARSKNASDAARP